MRSFGESWRELQATLGWDSRVKASFPNKQGFIVGVGVGREGKREIIHLVRTIARTWRAMLGMPL